MSWCETNQVDYAFGFARNERLRRMIEPQMQEAAVLYQQTGHAARVFTEFTYETNASRSRARRVVAKAEQIAGKENPRYVVTSLAASSWPARKLYEELYCARGDMENRNQGTVFVIRGKSQCRHLARQPVAAVSLGCSLCAVSAFRRLALSATEWARAQCETIRLQLVRIAAQVRVTARKV